VFEHFVHVKDQSSSGIGLYLSYQLIKVHKGDIRFEISDLRSSISFFVVGFLSSGVRKCVVALPSTVPTAEFPTPPQLILSVLVSLVTTSVSDCNFNSFLFCFRYQYLDLQDLEQNFCTPRRFGM
jgi:hypothetical protein